MKRLVKKTQKVVKGTPSAVVLSILIHAGIFLGAGLLVVFTFAEKPPTAFEPPPKRKIPKMPLKKLKIMQKKPSKPKSTAKLTAVVPKLSLHEIQFPDLASSGIGAGLNDSGSAGGFLNLSIEDTEGIFGKEKSIGNDLEVTFYDSKRARSGSLRTSDGDYCQDLLAKFIRQDWDRSVFSKIYRSPKKRYATCIVIPATMSYMAPALFGKKDAYPGNWIALYKGKLVHTEDITFRF